MEQRRDHVAHTWDDRYGSVGSEEYSCRPLRMRSRSTYSAGFAFMILAMACGHLEDKRFKLLCECCLMPLTDLTVQNDPHVQAPVCTECNGTNVRTQGHGRMCRCSGWQMSMESPGP